MKNVFIWSLTENVKDLWIWHKGTVLNLRKKKCTTCIFWKTSMLLPFPVCLLLLRASFFFVSRDFWASSSFYSLHWCQMIYLTWKKGLQNIWFCTWIFQQWHFEWASDIFFFLHSNSSRARFRGKVCSIVPLWKNTMHTHRNGFRCTNVWGMWLGLVLIFIFSSECLRFIRDPNSSKATKVFYLKETTAGSGIILSCIHRTLDRYFWKIQWEARVSYIKSASTKIIGQNMRKNPALLSTAYTLLQK